MRLAGNVSLRDMKRLYPDQTFGWTHLARPVCLRIGGAEQGSKAIIARVFRERCDTGGVSGIARDPVGLVERRASLPCRDGGHVNNSKGRYNVRRLIDERNGLCRRYDAPVAADGVALRGRPIGSNLSHTASRAPANQNVCWLHAIAPQSSGEFLHLNFVVFTQGGGSHTETESTGIMWPPTKHLAGLDPLGPTTPSRRGGAEHGSEATVARGWRKRCDARGISDIAHDPVLLESRVTLGCIGGGQVYNLEGRSNVRRRIEERDGLCRRNDALVAAHGIALRVRSIGSNLSHANRARANDNVRWLRAAAPEMSGKCLHMNFVVYTGRGINPPSGH
jgi:hypothetical protein